MHHRVEISDAALVAAARASAGWAQARRLPGRAIDLVDEAASRLPMEIDTRPMTIDELQRAVDRLKMEELALALDPPPGGPGPQRPASGLRSSPGQPQWTGLLRLATVASATLGTQATASLAPPGTGPAGAGAGGLPGRRHSGRHQASSPTRRDGIRPARSRRPPRRTRTGHHQVAPTAADCGEPAGHDTPSGGSRVS
jgi:hypothetical protein